MAGIILLAVLYLKNTVPSSDRIEQHYANVISFLGSAAYNEGEYPHEQVSSLFAPSEILMANFQAGTNSTLCLKTCDDVRSSHGPLESKVQYGTIGRRDGSSLSAIVYEDYVMNRNGELRRFLIFFDPLKLKNAVSDD